MPFSHALENTKSRVPTLKQLLSADLNYEIRSLRQWSKLLSEGLWKHRSGRVLFAVDAVFGVLTARSPACKSKTNVLIHYPSDRSSTSIPTFMFTLSDLRNISCNNPGRLLLEVLSSKLQLCGHTAVACMMSGIWYDVTVQVFNWPQTSDKWPYR